MKDYCLKAPTEEEMKAGLKTAGFIIENEYWLDSQNHSLVVIGEIFKPTGEFTESTDEDGNINQLAILQKVYGFHANIRMIDADLPEILQPFVIFPQNPMFGWL